MDITAAPMPVLQYIGMLLQLGNSAIRLHTTTPRVAVFRGLEQAVLECRYNSPTDDSILGVNWYRKTMFDKTFKLIVQIPQNRPPVVVDRNMQLTTKPTYNRTNNLAIVKLIITKVQCIDEAAYQCELQLYGQPALPRPEMRIVVYEKPTKPNITQYPRIIKENTNTKFKCTGYVGKPQGRMQWVIVKNVRGRMKRTEISGTSSRVPMFSQCLPDAAVESTIQLPVTRYDVTMECIITQPSIDEHQIHTERYSKTLDVRYSVRSIRASIDINGKQVRTSNEIRAVEGDSITLTCSSSGNPKPDYKWRFLPPTGSTLGAIRLTKGHTQAVLTLSNITNNHTGSYICVSRNFVELRPFSVSKVLKLIVSDRSHYSHETSSLVSTSTQSQRLTYPRSVINYIMVGGVVGVSCIFVLLLSIIIANCTRRVASPTQLPRTYQVMADGTLAIETTKVYHQ